MATISVPGASGTHLIFTVTGSSTTNYAKAFAAAVNAAESKGKLTLNVVDAKGDSKAGATVLNELVAKSAATFTPLTGQYTLIDTSATVTGSTAGHDTILAGGDNSLSGTIAATYSASGSDNMVTFINGNDTYDGSKTGSGDTITSGSGSDTINTGSGSSTVFSGVGTALINLNNTTGSDVVYLGDGMSTVVANGVSDTVAAASAGQLILGGGSNSSLTVGIESTVAGASGPADDVIIGRGSAVTVFDSVGGNTIFGGTGNLTFVGQTGAQPVQDTILAGSGFNAIVGFNGADITFAASSSSGSVGVVAGAGNETLNGANAANFTVYGDTTASASSNSTFVASYSSSATDIFSTGAGTQAYEAGNAANLFELDTVSASSGGPAHITIFGFGANDMNMVGFGNDSANAAADLNSGTVTASGNLVLTLSDKTTVTFVGVQSLTGHTTT